MEIIKKEGCGGDSINEDANSLINRINLLMRDVEEYNTKNKDKLNIGLYLNYKNDNSKYNNRVYYYKNMDSDKMAELMVKEEKVRKYILKFKNKESKIKTKVKSSEIDNTMKNSNIIKIEDRFKSK